MPRGKKIRRWCGFSLLEWGALFALASLLKLTLSGFLLFPSLSIGILRIPTYMLPELLCAGLCLMGAFRLINRPGAATAMTLLLSIMVFASALFVPWATRELVASQGLHYRIPGMIPHFELNTALLPLFVLPAALIVDGIALWQTARARLHLWQLGLLISIPQLLIAPCVIMWNANLWATFLDAPGMLITPDLKLPVAALLIPVWLATGIVGTLWGASMGAIWHQSRR